MALSFRRPMRLPGKSEPWTRTMKMILNIVGVLMILMGAIWFLQGINILPGSFMTGQIRWAVYGGATAFAGFGLVVARNRRRRQRVSAGGRAAGRRAVFLNLPPLNGRGSLHLT